MTHRLTIRLDDEHWRVFEQFCETNGVSATALMEAMIENWTFSARENQMTAVEAWHLDSYYKSLGIRTIQRARAIDADRRKRQ